MEKTIDVTVPGNGYVLTNPKLSHLILYHGMDLDLRKLSLKTAKRMAEDPACRFIQAETTAPAKKDAPAAKASEAAKG